VLVEKPLALDVVGCQRVAAAARATRRIVAVDHLLRFAPLVVAVHRLLGAVPGHKRLLPAVRRFSFENDAADEGLDDDHWFWDEARSGGVFIEHGVHFFDLATSFIGHPPTAVQGLATGSRPARTDTVCATATFAGGATATWYHSFTHRRTMERQHWRLDVGDAEIRLDGWVPLTLDVEAGAGDISSEASGLFAEIAADPALGLRHEQPLRLAHDGVDAKDTVYRHCIDALLADLLDAIDRRRPPTTGLGPATAAVALAEAATIAASTGRTVPVARP
jgi:predicted dehydrogenase